MAKIRSRIWACKPKVTVNWKEAFWSSTPPGCRQWALIPAKLWAGMISQQVHKPHSASLPTDSTGYYVVFYSLTQNNLSHNNQLKNRTVYEIKRGSEKNRS